MDEARNDAGATIANLYDLLAQGQDGPAWTLATRDLNVNLLRWDDGRGVAEHVNNEVDVLLVVLHGEGIVTISDREHALRPGSCCLIPRGTKRSIRALGGAFAYLSCHRARAGLMPV